MSASYKTNKHATTMISQLCSGAFLPQKLKHIHKKSLHESSQQLFFIIAKMCK